MGVEVIIPFDLHLEPRVVGPQILPLLDESVFNATTRALRDMDEKVLDRVGGYMQPRFTHPQYQWTFDQQAVPAELRERIEDQVTGAIARAIQASPSHITQARLDAPEVFPPSPFEPVDPARFLGEEYVVPSYEGDVPAPDVPIALDNRDLIRQFRETHDLSLWVWSGNRGELREKLASYFEQVDISRFAIGETIGALINGPIEGLRRAFIVVACEVTSRSENGVRVEIQNLFSIGRGFTSYDPQDGSESSTRGTLPPMVILRKEGAFANKDDLEALIYRHIIDTLGVTIPDSGGTAEEVTASRVLRGVARSMSEGCIHDSGNMGLLGSIICSMLAGSFTGDHLKTFPVFSFRERPGRGGGGGSRSGGGTGGDGGSMAAGGSPLSPEGEDGEGRGRIYPVTTGGETVELDMGPFMGEPSLDELGELADPLRRLMRQIAFRLEMPEFEYAGAFAIAAAKMVGLRASSVAQYSETNRAATRVAAEGTGNLGSLDVQPVRSPSVQVLRFIAGTCPIMSRFQRLMVSIYNRPEVAVLITGRRHREPVGWSLDFYKAYTPALKESTGHLYIRTCQVMLLQLLRNSQMEIQARLDNFDRYYRVVRALILGIVADEAVLQRLRDRLRSAISDRGGFSAEDFNATIGGAYDSWREARQALSTSLSQQILNVSVASTAQAQQGEIVPLGDSIGIRDEHGRIWSMQDLEQAIAMRHGTATSIDPLIHQFSNIPDVVQTFRLRPDMARQYLEALLEEMLQNNQDQREETVDDFMHAFRMGPIQEDLPQRTIPNTSYALQGIHLMAHSAIGDAFRGDLSYALGINYVFGIEQGLSGLISFFETLTVITLSVICPPAGAALGAAIAAVHYDQASEQVELYGALINPEEILRKSDVEMALFMAEFELALSIIPEIGSIGRGLSTTGRTVARHGVRGAGQAARSLGRRARRELIVSMGRQAKRGLARALITEIMTEAALTPLLPRLLGPFFTAINREISAQAGTPIPQEVQSAAENQDPDAVHPPSEDETELIRRLEEYEGGDRDEDLPGPEEAP